MASIRPSAHRYCIVPEARVVFATVVVVVGATVVVVETSCSRVDRRCVTRAVDVVECLVVCLWVGFVVLWVVVVVVGVVVVVVVDDVVVVIRFVGAAGLVFVLLPAM